MDYEQLSLQYTKSLMGLMNRIFSQKIKYNILELETIPAIQYCSESYLKILDEYNNKYVQRLDKSKSYLNIGTGSGILEYNARKYGIEIYSADIEETSLIFDPIREFLDVKLDYKSNLYSDILDINTNKRFDYIMFIRYVPFEHNFNKNQFKMFLKSCNKYSDKALISLVANSYIQCRKYLNGPNNFVLKRMVIENADVYEVDLTRL